MYPQRTNTPLQALDRRALTVGAISGPIYQEPCLPDIYALAFGHCVPLGVMCIYEAKHSCLCYNLYIYTMNGYSNWWSHECFLVNYINEGNSQKFSSTNDSQYMVYINIIIDLHQLLQHMKTSSYLQFDHLSDQAVIRCTTELIVLQISIKKK